MELARPAHRHAPRLDRSAALAAALAATTLAACSGSGHVHHDPPEVPYYDVWESEPNDSHCCADYVGTLYVGSEVVIAGRIRDDFADPFDGFAFQSGEPIEVHFVLEPLGDADLDLCVWDPWIGDFVFCFDSPGTVEFGHFVVPSSFDSFHLVASSFAGDAEYRLTVWAEPVSLGGFATAAAAEPELDEPGYDKRARAVPFELYGPPREAASEPEAPAVLDRGVAVEIDEETGEVFVRDLVLRTDGLFLGPAR